VEIGRIRVAACNSRKGLPRPSGAKTKAAPKERNKLMRRIIAVAGALILLATLFPASATGHVSENQYQVISARNAYAAFSMTDGCLETQVWVSSADGVYGGRPGPVTKQGLTSLDVVVYDTCQPFIGKHPPVVFEVFGQDLTSLGSMPRMTRAWVSTAYESFDEATGDPVTVSFAMTWQLDGIMEHDTSHIHVPPSDQGVANSHENDLRGAAIASGWITINGTTITLGPTDGAGLELIRGGCQVIYRPGRPSDLSCI
jgi:hypothetical protein